MYTDPPPRPHLPWLSSPHPSLGSTHHASVCPLSSEPPGWGACPPVRMRPGVSLFLCSPGRRVCIPAPPPPFSFTPCSAQGGLGGGEGGSLWGSHPVTGTCEDVCHYQRGDGSAPSTFPAHLAPPSTLLGRKGGGQPLGVEGPETLSGKLRGQIHPSAKFGDPQPVVPRSWPGSLLGTGAQQKGP